MKIKILAGLIISILLFSFIGCVEKKSETACVKCGKEATCTISGTANDMTSEGISLNKCSNITSNIYTAHLCDSCLPRTMK